MVLRFGHYHRHHHCHHHRERGQNLAEMFPACGNAILLSSRVLIRTNVNHAYIARHVRATYLSLRGERRNDRERLSLRESGLYLYTHVYNFNRLHERKREKSDRLFRRASPAVRIYLRHYRIAGGMFSPFLSASIRGITGRKRPIVSESFGSSKTFRRREREKEDARLKTTGRFRERSVRGGTGPVRARTYAAACARCLYAYDRELRTAAALLHMHKCASDADLHSNCRTIRQTRHYGPPLGIVRRQPKEASAFGETRCQRVLNADRNGQ